MSKGAHFLEQPEPISPKVAGQLSNHRLNNHHAFLQPAFQGHWTTSENGQEERRHKGLRQHTRQ